MKQWSEYLKLKEREIGKQATYQWLASLKILKFDACNLYLEAANQFQINWVKEHLPKLSFYTEGRSIKLHLSLPTFGVPEEMEPPPSDFSADPLDPEATFPHFVRSKENDLPFKLLGEVAEGTGELNPLFLHGPKGCGKTHLLMATAHALLEKGILPFYVKGETFADHVVNAFRSGAVETFRSTYREIDALLIDDVHLLARKLSTQEELFHTFNRLHTSGVKIILSSNLPPSGLEGIEERLVSRFEWGIALPLTPPGPRELLAILRTKASLLNLSLSDQVSAFLIETFPNASSLTTALHGLALRAPPGTLAARDVEGLLGDLIRKERERKLTPQRIVKGIADIFGITTEDVQGKSQRQEEALARQLAMYLCREKLHMPYQKIGYLFKRDHSTVMTSVKKVEEKVKKKDERVLSSLIAFYNGASATL